jgi:hypothetical protein
MMGIYYFLKFAVGTEALSELEAEKVRKGAWKALKSAAAAQTRGQAAEEPVRRFLELIASAIFRGDAHLGDASSEVENEKKGRLVGWYTDEDPGVILLEPDSAYAVANQLAQQQGDSLRVSKQTLWKRLRERRVLSRHEKDRNTVRADVRGARRTVLCVRKSVVFPSYEDV